MSPIVEVHANRILEFSLHNFKFSLDISGLAGFFSSDVAVEAMTTVLIYEGRKKLGWYNMPGSYEIAKRYGRLAKSQSRFWNGLHSVDSVDPATIFELDGKEGPPYRGVHSGTIMSKTGHVAHLILEECQSIPDPIQVQGRCEPSLPVSIVRLPSAPPEEVIVRRLRKPLPFLALIPILMSVGAGFGCTMLWDWYCLAMIALGMFAGGISYLAIGRGTLAFTHSKPPHGASPGDGLLEKGDETVILLGDEDAVGAVTRGAFSLRFAKQSHYHAIGLCSVFLRAHVVVSVLAVWQGTIYGQILFFASLSISWVYNAYLCSTNRWEAQRTILREQIFSKPIITKYLLPTRTSMVVFVLMILATRTDKPETEILQDMLVDFLPNKTRVWREWRKAVWKMIEDPAVDSVTVDASVQETMSESEWRVLMELVGDANDGRRAFDKHCSAAQGQTPLHQEGGNGHKTDTDLEAQQSTASLSGSNSDTENPDQGAAVEGQVESDSVSIDIRLG